VRGKWRERTAFDLEARSEQLACIRLWGLHNDPEKVRKPLSASNSCWPFQVVQVFLQDSRPLDALCYSPIVESDVCVKFSKREVMVSSWRKPGVSQGPCSPGSGRGQVLEIACSLNVTGFNGQHTDVMGIDPRPLRKPGQDEGTVLAAKGCSGAFVERQRRRPAVTDLYVVSALHRLVASQRALGGESPTFQIQAGSGDITSVGPNSGRREHPGQCWRCGGRPSRQQLAFNPTQMV
jgi:hypothetical protein